MHWTWESRPYPSPALKSFAKRCRPGNLPPRIDHRERLYGGQLIERRKPGGVLHRCVEAMAQLLDRSSCPRAGAGEVHQWVGCTDGLDAPHEHRVPVAADLLAQQPTFVGCGRLRDEVVSGAAEALLDAVLAEQSAEFGAQVAAVLGVHQGTPFVLAASSMSRSSST